MHFGSSKHSVHYNLCIGLTITEVAHDIHSGVTNYVMKTLKLVNSYDTWHGNLYACWCFVFALILTFCVCRIKECGQGDGKDCFRSFKGQRKTWFPELVDKHKSASVYIIIRIPIILCEQLFRKEYQGPLILGNEELWWITREVTAADKKKHSGPLQGALPEIEDIGLQFPYTN